MKSRKWLLTLIAMTLNIFLLFFITPQAHADNCGSFSDCLGTIDAALLALLAVTVIIGLVLLLPEILPFLFEAASEELLIVGEESAEGLIAELEASGTNFSADAMVGITRSAAGDVVWLEEGNASAGLEHIMAGHGGDFANIGIEGEQNVAKLLLDTLNSETPIGVTNNGAKIFQVVVDGVEREIAIVVGKNGFIVTAFPL